MKQNIKPINEDYMNNAWRTHSPSEVIEQYSNIVYESNKNDRSRYMLNTEKFNYDTTELVVSCHYIDQKNNVQRIHTMTIEGNRDELNQLRFYLDSDPRLMIDDISIY